MFDVGKDNCSRSTIDDYVKFLCVFPTTEVFIPFSTFSAICDGKRERSRSRARVSKVEIEIERLMLIRVRFHLTALLAPAAFVVTWYFVHYAIPFDYEIYEIFS